MNNNENKYPDVNIVLTSRSGKGKSRISYLIYKFLQKEGFEVTFTDEDFEDVEELNENLDFAIEMLKNKNTTINISNYNVYENISNLLNEKIELGIKK